MKSCFSSTILVVCCLFLLPIKAFSYTTTQYGYTIEWDCGLSDVVSSHGSTQVHESSQLSASGSVSVSVTLTKEMFEDAAASESFVSIAFHGGPNGFSRKQIIFLAEWQNIDGGDKLFYKMCESIDKAPCKWSEEYEVPDDGYTAAAAVTYSLHPRDFLGFYWVLICGSKQPFISVHLSEAARRWIGNLTWEIDDPYAETSDIEGPG